MANNDKITCNLTENEIGNLIGFHGQSMALINVDRDHAIERINYLNKRLKAFNQPETETETKPAAPVATGWGTPTT